MVVSKVSKRGGDKKIPNRKRGKNIEEREKNEEENLNIWTLLDSVFE